MFFFKFQIFSIRQQTLRNSAMIHLSDVNFKLRGIMLCLCPHHYLLKDAPKVFVKTFANVLGDLHVLNVLVMI